MGCDIHCYAERKVDGKWEKIGKDFPYPYYQPEQPTEVDDDGYEWNAQFVDRVLCRRNYDLFAILANVRNGRGFAGVITGGGFNVIAMPKGLPADVSEEVKAQSEEWGEDGHSHSWLTVAEILAFNWNQGATQYGVVNPAGFKEFLEKGAPSCYSGGVSGPTVVHMTNEQMRDYVESPGNYNPTYHYYTRVEWGEGYREAAGKEFWDALEKLKTYGAPEDVRIVFWFDN